MNDDGSLSPNVAVHLAVASNSVGHMDPVRLEFNPIIETMRGPFLPAQAAHFSAVIQLITSAGEIFNGPEPLQSAAHGRISTGTESFGGSFYLYFLCFPRKAN